MTTHTHEVEMESVIVGDTITEFMWTTRYAKAYWTKAAGPGSPLPVVTKVDGAGNIWTDTHGCWHSASEGRVRVRVMRFTKKVFATVDVPSRTSSAPSDWPLACPRCGRQESAVMLFVSMDCRHGCFR